MNYNNDYIVEMLDVFKSFESNDVHRGINLKIKRGENICILGESGSGKVCF